MYHKKSITFSLEFISLHTRKWTPLNTIEGSLLDSPRNSTHVTFIFAAAQLASRVETTFQHKERWNRKPSTCIPPPPPPPHMQTLLPYYSIGRRRLHLIKRPSSPGVLGPFSLGWVGLVGSFLHSFLHCGDARWVLPGHMQPCHDGGGGFLHVIGWHGGANPPRSSLVKKTSTYYYIKYVRLK